MMVIQKEPNCHTATEDCTQQPPAPQLQDPPIPVTGLAAAEVHNTRHVEVITVSFNLIQFLKLHCIYFMWGGCEELTH